MLRFQLLPALAAELFEVMVSLDVVSNLITKLVFPSDVFLAKCS
jgi:hypothetical protein